MTDIKGYEGKYAITSCGKVYSYRSKKFLKPKQTRQGYLQVELCRNGSKESKYIHRLVAETYIPNPLGLSEVNHKNEIKTDNYINNLEWISHEDNMRYGSRTAKTQKPVVCIELGKTFQSITLASSILNVEASSISRVCKGERKTAGGYHFKYEEVI